MITGLIHVAQPADPDAVERLADTLSALVAGVVAGLVADALILSDSDSDALRVVAEASGAGLVVHGRDLSPWRAGALAARRRWVLCLDAGDLPREGWIRAIDRFVDTARPGMTFARLHRPQARFGAWVTSCGERVLGVREPRAGDLVCRDRLVADKNGLVRVRPHRLPVRIDRP